MRTALFLCLSSFLYVAASTDSYPFNPASFPDVRLAKRQNNCPAGYGSCVQQGAPGACCQPDSVCSRDAANHIACCPIGSVCTGFVSTILSPSTTGFRFPQPASSTITPGPTVTTGPTVTGAPFPFVYIPTAFRDESECLRSYSGCLSQLTLCQAALAGVNGVTIGGNNGFGLTVQPMPTSQAQSVCSSLHNEACYGLQPGHCTAYPGGVASPGAASSPTRSSALYEILTGLLIALAGMIA